MPASIVLDPDVVAGYDVNLHGGTTGALPPNWGNNPKFHTRSELLKSRKLAKRPDRTFDLDGDGFVSQTDYLVSSKFDWNKDGKLDSAEKDAALQYIHKTNPRSVYQTHDMNTVAATFHHEIERTTQTRANLLSERKMENTTDMQHKYDVWKAAQPSGLKKDVLPSFPNPHSNTWSAIQQERRKQCRTVAGLLPTSSQINPARSGLDPSTGYQWNPTHPTRSDLLDHRKDDMLSAHERTLTESSAYFRSAQQRLKDREDSMHLMLQLAPKGMTRTQLLDLRRSANIDDLRETFTRHDRPPNDIPPEERPVFYTLAEGFNPNPAIASRTELWETRKFWKKKEEAGPDDKPFLTMSHKDFIIPGFTPGETHETKFAMQPQPRRPKAPQSTAIRSKLQVEDPLHVSPREDPMEARQAAMPLYSSFSKDEIFKPKPLPPTSAVNKEGKGSKKSNKKKTSSALEEPESMVAVLARQRPYSCGSLLETNCRIRSDGFQLMNATMN